MNNIPARSSPAVHIDITMPTQPSSELLLLIDFLDEIGSTFHVIPLGNLLAEHAERIGFLQDNHLIKFWETNLASVRQTCKNNIATLKKQVTALDITSPHFLNNFERAGIRAGTMLLKQIEGLQENVEHSWKAEMPKNAMLPALEILFREGEILRFQKILNTRCKQMKRPLITMLSDLKKELQASEGIKQTVMEKYRKKYTREAGHMLLPLETLLNTILSFYERKWSLLLIPENGKKD